MRELEARLGFNFTSGISRTRGARDFRVISELLDGIDEINTRYVAYGLKHIRISKRIKKQAEQIFYDLGPSLWPARDEGYCPWLFSRSSEESSLLAKAYPKDLSYSDSDDREM